ncbi:hypothetical protein [Phycicoccus sp. 3266]|uniref:phage tail tube protein n=1 Tax=Phycicoccus sp. 3266 TaxID=2817751 RepID=UPI0028601220|nr:hypothetical protein [Phycicoccus sp. 3266]MDR6861976.1 hypothetical protein [Phycicoccus sp. 3266]
MTKMLAQANTKLLWVPDGGIADPSAPTVAELTAAGVLDLSCLVTKANYNLGPTGDESVNDPALCADGNSSVPGNTNYEAGMDFFRFTDTAEDKAWTTFTHKGIEGFLVERKGKRFDVAITATDEVAVYGVITGTPRNLPVPDNGGFEKFRQDFFVQSELVDSRAIVGAGA